MLDTQRRSTGTQYTTTVALLLMAFVLSPAILIASRPFGFFNCFLALLGTATCATLAWFNWTKFSEVTILSIASRYLRAR